MVRDPVRTALQVILYVFLYMAAAFVFGPLLVWLGGYLAGVTCAGLLAACGANWLALRIYEGRPAVTAIGLGWRAGTGRNLLLGLAGGIGSATVVLAVPLAAGWAHLKPLAGAGTEARVVLFTGLMLLAGAAGEEILFRGYGFQVLVRALGPMAAVLPVGVLFAAMHAGNPGATPLGLANTAGFGVLFGYAFLRSRDLWLPIGLHFGWNFTLPLFGVNVSGLKIGVTGHVMEWTAGALWSGGAYGPEASLLTSGVLLALFAYLRQAPVEKQPAPLLDPAVEDPCVTGRE